MPTLPQDTEWKEREVHKNENADDEEGEEEDQFSHFFENEDKDELLEFSFHQPNIHIELRGHSEITNTTGLSVWFGAEVLCEFLLQNRAMVEEKSVLELGSGLGLTGILVSKHLNASRIVLTDGDSGVLKNLRSNLEHNNVSLDCPQLIWGRNLEEFRTQFERFQVILATDCIYMIPSLKPFWQTINALLEENEDAVVVYVNLCASQAPHEDVVEMANQFGFYCSSPSTKDVHLFHRRIDIHSGQAQEEEQKDYL